MPESTTAVLADGPSAGRTLTVPSPPPAALKVPVPASLTAWMPDPFGSSDVSYPGDFQVTEYRLACHLAQGALYAATTQPPAGAAEFDRRHVVVVAKDYATARRTFQEARRRRIIPPGASFLRATVVTPDPYTAQSIRGLDGREVLILEGYGSGRLGGEALFHLDVLYRRGAIAVPVPT